jgi:hypothetical protein
MIDSLTGSHLPTRESKTWAAAIAKFAAYNQYSQKARLTPPGFEPQETLPADPLQPRHELNFDEQLDFTVRQEACIRPLVLPADYDYRAPFMRKAWSEFILGVPRSMRENQQLYVEMLRRAYPLLFAVPTKNNMGLPYGSHALRKKIRGVRLGVEKTSRKLLPQLGWPAYPTTNYVDFGMVLRHDRAMQTLFRDNLANLQRRGAVDWLNIDALWQAHQDGKADNELALRLLLGLELLLATRAP